MPRNGTGTYTAPNNSWNPPVNGATATNADWATTQADYVAALSQSVSNDGQTPMIGNLPMGNNKITGLANGTSNTDAATIGNLNAVAGQAGGVGDRNLLINGNFAVNQRTYATGTATTVANQYTLDRWRVVTSGQSISFGAAAPDRVVTCPAGGLEQPIEAAMMAGGVYALSWTGTATAKVNGVSILSGGNTAVLPANTQAVIQFAGGTVSNAQFELGTASTPYQRRQLTAELLLCQRYFYVSLAALPGRCTTTAARFYIAYPVPLRTAPTTTIISSTIAWEEAQVASRGYLSTVLSSATLTINGGFFEITGTNANGVPTAGAFAQLNSTGSFQFSAEL